MRRGGFAISICGLLGLLAAAPAQAAFPGVPGPIAYSYSNFTESGGSGGLRAHGPRKRDGTRPLTTGPDDSSPSYSPNGRLIAFSGNRDTGVPRSSHIYVMSNDGSDVRQLTSGAFYDGNPSFAPDGRHVVFDRDGAGAGDSQIFSVSIDGTDLRQISDGVANDYDPVFTPNGRRTVFVSNRQSSGRTDRSNIFSMRPDGSRVRISIGGPRSEFDPDVSPNGRKIAFSSNRDRGPNLFVAKMNGKRVRELTHSRHDCFGSACYTNPSWSPDGKHIAFLSIGRYSSSVEVMRTDGRGYAKEFGGGGTEEEGYGSHVGAPGWGVRPR
jgi:Tol biopolymer transport system component